MISASRGSCWRTPKTESGGVASRQAGDLGQLIHGRNAVLEAARAGRVLKIYQAAGLGDDPRLEELAKLSRVEVVPAARLDAIAPGVNQGVAAELTPRGEG